MASKRKGTRYERELFHMFWSTGTWSSLRSAGSGSTPLPAPDLIASNGSKILAIECKSIKKGIKYIEQEKIDELTEFSKKFGAEAWIAMRFDNFGWFFIKPEDLKKTKNNIPSISLKFAQKKALKFEDLTKN